jgi:hypothetical protein
LLFRDVKALSAVARIDAALVLASHLAPAMPRLNGYAAKISLDVVEKAIQLYGHNYPKRPKRRRRRI